MKPTSTDRLRGMILLSAYGDAFGAEHEGVSSIHPAPFPDRLPTQNIGAVTNRWGYWVTQAEAGNAAKGIPTDDTAFKLFILHRWLESNLEGDACFSEISFRQFIAQLNGSSIQPAVIGSPRDGQIDSWLNMYQAAEASPPRIKEFFEPGVPVVFGFFLFLEMAALRTDYQAIENFHFFRNITILDQGYAKTATGFLLAITALAFSSDPSVQGFDDWFLQEFEKLTSELGFEESNNQDVLIIERIFETMTSLGRSLRGSTPYEFMVAFEQTVIEPTQPPFMNQAFQQAVFDPFRMLAEMVAVVAYAEGCLLYTSDAADE